MKTKFRLLFCLIVAAHLAFIQFPSFAVTAYPYPIEFTQPDGSKITIQLKGDEKIHWAVTTDGYTLLFDSTGTYQYAMLNSQNDLVPSGIKANNLELRNFDEVYFLENTPKALSYSKTQISIFKQIWNLTSNPAKLGGFPTTGTRKFLMILANYSNTAPTYTQAMFNNYMNQVNYNGTGSFRDYFIENSYGQLIVNTTVTVWVTLTNPHNYYSTSSNDSPNWVKMVYDAIVAADPLVDYSQYDNNGDGVVDGVAVIHQGMGQEESGSINDVWSHNWSLISAGYSAAARTFDGVKVDPYTTQPELSSSGMGTIGVMCHEFGHNLGANDYYDTDYATGGQYDGTGDWDLQAGGSWNGSPAGSSPAHSNAYTKTAVYLWATAQSLTAGCNMTLYNTAQNSNSFYKIATNTANEYYLLENKQQVGFDSYLPGHGMIIYHVSATVTSPINAAHPNKMYIVSANAPVAQPFTAATPSQYGTTNSSSCPYPGTGSETSFTDLTIPCSKSWAGVNTAKPITNISENTTLKTISFTFNGGPGCSPPTNQASIFTSSAISTNAMTVGWTRGNGTAVLVVARAGGPVNADPVLGTSYTANATFGSGTAIGSGNFVIYKGTGTSVDVTNLVTNTNYYYAIYEYNGTNCYNVPALTGNALTVTTPTPTVSNFTSDVTTIYVGQNVSFSETATYNPTSWLWTFEGGIPSTSTDRTPIVKWITNGTYDVSLTATNADGSDIETKTDYITVNNLPTLPSPNPVTIGASTNSGTYFPLGIGTTAAYRYVVDASIYTSAEIGGGGKITKIEWRPSTSQTDVRNIQIFLKNTASSTFTASTTGTYTAGATWVYSGTFTPNVAGYFAFDLSNEFIYDGTSNLMVLVLANTSATPGNKASNCYYTTAANKHQQWSGSTQPTGNGTVNGNRPNVRLTFFTTPAAPVANFAGLNYVINENFEGGTFPPTGWANLKGATGNLWSTNTAAAHGGTYAAEYMYNATTAATAWLISPGVSLTAGTTYTIKYWERVGSGYTEKLKVTVGTAQTIAGQTTTLQTLAALANTAYALQTTTYTPVSSGTYYFGWNCYSAANMWYLNVDDITVSSDNYTQVSTYEGASVSMFDKSTGNPISWEWTTTGATTTTFGTQNITATYNTAGIYPVSLKAVNLGGSNTKTINTFVNVVGRAPIANFNGAGNLKTIAYQPFIPKGGTVTYSDLTTLNPTSWSWTFSNGTPASSTLQSPPVVTYNTVGNQDVSLYTANATGNNTKAATGYVNVGGTFNVTNWLPTDGATAYTLTGGSGYLPGHCANSSAVQITKYAEFYKNSYPGTVTGVLIKMTNLMAGTGKNVTLCVWDGSTGTPGTLLGSQTYLITDFTANADNTKTFTSSVHVTGDFFVGYSLNYDAGHNYTTHQFLPFMAVNRGTSSTVSTAWLMASGTWSSMKDFAGVSSSIAIRPAFTYDACPTAFNVTGGGTYCSGDPGVAIGLDGSTSGVNYQLKRDGVNDGSVVAGTNAAISFGNKTIPGTYTVDATLVSTSCTINMTGSATVTANACYSWTAGASTTNWSTAGNWSTGKVPVASDAVVITSAPALQPQVTAASSCNNLTINPGAKLTINNTKSLTVGGKFLIQSDATGTGSFIDFGSLTVTGTTTVQKYLLNNRWCYISSPLSSSITASTAFGTLGGLTSHGKRMYYYTEGNNGNYTSLTPFTDSYNLSATKLQGYVFKNYDAVTNVNFTGTLNTGTIARTDLTKSGTSFQGYNLICNPYPSALDLGTWNGLAATTTTGITVSNLVTTVWFNNGSSFCTYNWASGDGQGIPVPNSEVPAMQAFWVRVSSGTGSFSIPNTARVHSNNAFYKTASTSNVFRINVSDAINTDEAVVGFYPNALTIFENYDSEKMFSNNNDAPQIYTLTSDNTMAAINGLPLLGLNEIRVVPLGFLSNLGGNFTLNASNLADFDITIPVFLEDVSLGVIQDLRQNASYSFASGAINSSSRFRLHFGSMTTEISNDANASISIYSFSNSIYVTTAKENGIIEVYDMLGKKVLSSLSKTGVNILQVNTSDGIYLVKVIYDGVTKTKQILISK